MSITFEFSKQEDLLKQYYLLRQECFRKELGLDAFDGTEDYFDQTGKILLLREGDSCIGGVRITGSHEVDGAALPLEHKGLDMAHLLSGLSLEVAPYCQWERLVLKPDYRNTEMLRAICKALIRGCASLGYHYAFNVTGLKRARLYKRIHSSLGYHYRIFDQVQLPVEQDFAHLEHLFSVAFIPEAERAELHGQPPGQAFAGLWQGQRLACAA